MLCHVGSNQVEISDLNIPILSETDKVILIVKKVGKPKFR